MNRFIILLAGLMLSVSAWSQSISGNLNAESSKKALKYGNVDIYKDDKLVASVLTDKMGNFNVALDTGIYKCVINYAGFESETKEIHVKKDEKVDFSIKEDPKKPIAQKNGLGIAAPVESKSVIDGVYIEEHIPTKRMIAYETLRESGGETTIDYEGIFPSTAKPNLGGTSGALTAGEINDFSKWKLWQDIVASELSAYQAQWNIAPKGRYTVMLQSQSGLPLADAIVRLLDGNRKLLFSTRSDNTGKAECWLTIRNETPQVTGKLSMEVEYMGKVTKINHAKAFEESMNHLTLNVSCEAIENVDIAFVVDATGSMGDELSYLQAEMNDIVYQSKQISSKLNFRFANVFYRDLGANELYSTKQMDFNRVLTESTAYITDQSAGGGGDYEEAVEIALDSAINKLSWSEQARTRVLFLILDAPPHNTPAIQEKLERLIRQAAEKGIRIVPIGASGINKSTEYLMRSIALGTNGTYTFLTDHSGIGNSHIQPSTDKFDVETLNKLMVRILKSYTYMPDCDQQIPDLALDYPDSIVAYPPRDSVDTNTQNTPATIRWNYYPNPTNGIVNIVPDVAISELYITDLTGKVLQVLSNLEKDRVIQVDLSQYATGIYLIRYPVGKSWVSGKVVLQRTS